MRAVLPFTFALAIAAAGPALAQDGRSGGRLVLTDGVSSVEGSAGGGLATWALIAGHETERGVGGSAHATIVVLPDFTLKSYGLAAGLWNRVELSYAHQDFDTRAVGAALGLGRNFILSQDIIGAKLRLTGDAVWDQDRWWPQVAIGVQHKIAAQGAVIAAVGGKERRGTDFYASATKLFLAQGVVLGGTLRYTKANQFGLLGFGGDQGTKRTAQFEGSAGMLLSRKLLVGAEYRSRPDNLGFAEEDDAVDAFAAWSAHRSLTVTAAWVDLGEIAAVKRQRGVFLSLQGAF
jgi:hypothetical protein